MRTRVDRPVVVFVLAALAAVAGCGERPQAPATEVVAVRSASLPEDAADPAWQTAPPYRAELLLQDLVEPRLLEPSTPNVVVRAMTDGERVAFRLEWNDATENATPNVSRFVDACAVQLPRTTEPDVPDPQMGGPGRPVEITLWRASWQAWVDGRKDDIHALYPNAAIDHYPFEAASLEPGSDAQRRMALRYAPARRLGNVMEGPRERPVQDLVGEGPGTLSPAPEQRSTGRGTRTASGWEVVIVRPLPTQLGPEGRSEIAFAVWDGDKNEAGARKMRSGWIPLALGGGA